MAVRSVLFFHMPLLPSPRNFYHLNQSDPRHTWSDKYEYQATQCSIPTKNNIILGDSHVERLLRLPSLPPQLGTFINAGVGGDKLQHVIWRATHGCMPVNVEKVLIVAGSNNLRPNSSVKECKELADTIIQCVSDLLLTNSNIMVAVVGILPRKSISYTNNAEFVTTYLDSKYPLKPHLYCHQINSMMK